MTRELSMGSVGTGARDSGIAPGLHNPTPDPEPRFLET
jgi:hypothetical protein